MKKGETEDFVRDSQIPVQLAKSLHLDRNKELSMIRICRNNDISFMGLFGSYSRGEQKEKSDLDFLANFSRRKSLLDLVRIERNLSEIIGIKVDLFTEKSISPYLIDKIKKEVKPLYHD